MPIRTVIQPQALSSLFSELRKRGYITVGPTVRDGAIVYREIASPNDLPIGWGEVQSGGSYRLQQRDDRAFFGFTIGPDSWKKFLYPPSARLWSARKSGTHSFEIVPQEPDATAFAFIGVRPCELQAIGIQDKVFLSGVSADPLYRERRSRALIVAVNCSVAAETCFCTSMNSGPRAESGFDIALTEVLDRDDHFLVAESGSKTGEEILSAITSSPAGAAQLERAVSVSRKTAESIRRQLDAGARELLHDNPDHPRWNHVAGRCLTCANCTMVCPTCFCSTVEDVNDVRGEHTERWRRWDSCFTMDFSFIHGGSIRSSVQSRYRQWLTHKLSAWVDQFGVSGCVGCGRCITWCPVGIDLTEEIHAMKEAGPARQGDIQ